MGDLADMVAGIVGGTIYVLIYHFAPDLAMSGIGMFMGVMAMRMTRGYFVLSKPQTT